MPGSSQLLDDHIRNVIRRAEGTRFLDLGCGAGKYGWFTKEIRPEATIEGYEIDASYVDRFGLSQWYDTVHVASCMDVLDRVDDTWDLVTIGDCIEHLRKSDGIDLINFLVYRCKYLLVCWPDQFLQGAVDGHRHEAHISVWTPSDFAPFAHGHRTRPPMHLVLVDGYQPHGRRAEELL